MKRYLITSAALFVIVSLYSTWRGSCAPRCVVETVFLGLPVFLKSPVVPGTAERPEFFLIPFLANVIWTAAVSVGFWAIVETFGRWQDRRREPPALS